MLAMPAMVAKKVKWWRKSLNAGDGGEKELIARNAGENAGASGKRFFFGYNVPHPPTPI